MSAPAASSLLSWITPLALMRRYWPSDSAPRVISVDGDLIWLDSEEGLCTMKYSSLFTKVVTTLAGLKQSKGTSGTTDATGTNAKFYQPRVVLISGTTLYVGVDNLNGAIQAIGHVRCGAGDSQAPRLFELGVGAGGVGVPVRVPPARVATAGVTIICAFELEKAAKKLDSATQEATARLPLKEFLEMYSL